MASKAKKQPAARAPGAAVTPRRGGQAPAKILNAAVEEFGRHGFEGANLAAIAKRAGVVKPLVYYHFKTKDELWYATVTHAMAELQAQMAQMPFELRGMPPVEAFKLALRKYSYFCAHNPWVARMILSELVRDTPRAAWVQSQYQDPAYRLFEDIHGQVAASGRFRNVAPSHLLPMINGAINAFAADHSILQQRYGVDSVDPQALEQHAEIVVDALLYGLLLPADARDPSMAPTAKPSR